MRHVWTCCQPLTFDLIAKSKYDGFLNFTLQRPYVILTFSSPALFYLPSLNLFHLWSRHLPPPALAPRFSSIVHQSTGNERRPLSARALLPSPRLHTSKWLAKPQATHSQWTGLLLTTVETYNMPGNRGNHSGGDGPMAIDTHPPTRLESVMCDLHPWFLSKRLHAFRCLSFIKQTLHLPFYGMKNAGSWKWKKWNQQHGTDLNCYIISLWNLSTQTRGE